jgi:hypothetical protein
VVSFTFWPFTSGKNIPRYSLDGRLGGSYADLDTVEKRNFLAPAEN